MQYLIKCRNILMIATFLPINFTKFNFYSFKQIRWLLPLLLGFFPFLPYQRYPTHLLPIRRPKSHAAASKESEKGERGNALPAVEAAEARERHPPGHGSRQHRVHLAVGWDGGERRGHRPFIEAARRQDRDCRRWRSRSGDDDEPGEQRARVARVPRLHQLDVPSDPSGWVFPSSSPFWIFRTQISDTQNVWSLLSLLC